MIFHFKKRKKQEVPEWVTCTQCGLEIPSAEGQRWEDRNTGEVVWTHRLVRGEYSCQLPFFREKEVGHLKKPPWLLRRLPIWN